MTVKKKNDMTKKKNSETDTVRLVLDVIDPAGITDYFDIEITPEIKNIIEEAKKFVELMPHLPLCEIVYRCPPFNSGTLIHYSVSPENVDTHGEPSMVNIKEYYIGITKNLGVYFKLIYGYTSDEVVSRTIPVVRILK